MKVLTLKLRDGDHQVFTPSTQFFIDLQEQHDIAMGDLEGTVTWGLPQFRNLIQCLLNDNEPDKNYTPEQVGRLMSVSDLDHYGEILKPLLEDAMPADEKPAEVPTGGGRPNPEGPPAAHSSGGDGQ